MDHQSIVNFICSDILFKGLELEDLGMEESEITNDTPLFEGGLELDSVDILEVIAATQREFKIRFDDVDDAFIAEHCHSPAKLATLVEQHLSKAA